MIDQDKDKHLSWLWKNFSEKIFLDKEYQTWKDTRKIFLMYTVPTPYSWVNFIFKSAADLEHNEV